MIAVGDNRTMNSYLAKWPFSNTVDVLIRGRERMLARLGLVISDDLDIVTIVEGTGAIAMVSILDEVCDDWYWGHRPEITGRAE